MSDTVRRWTAGIVTVALAAIIVVGVATGEPSPENRVRALGARIKCPVCQGEAIVDSPSDTAQAMMEIIAEQVDQGRSNQEIISYFTARYGDWILLDPPVAGRTLLLWVLPFVALAGGIALILGRRRRPDPGGTS